jgi:hypothetical protein
MSQVAGTAPPATCDLMSDVYSEKVLRIARYRGALYPKQAASVAHRHVEYNVLEKQDAAWCAPRMTYELQRSKLWLNPPSPHMVPGYRRSPQI